MYSLPCNLEELEALLAPSLIHAVTSFRACLLSLSSHPPTRAPRHCELYPNWTLPMALHSFCSPAAVSSPGTNAASVYSPRMIATAPSAAALLPQPPAMTVSCCRRPILYTLAWSSASNYVIRGEGTSAFLNGRLMTKCSTWKRAASPRCATIEEIEAEKSLIEEDARDRMEKAIDSLRANFNSIRTGRSNPAMLDRVEVEYYGSPVTLKSIAQISTPDSSSLLVQPYDKSSLKAIEKAIVNSDLGLTPNNDGEVIRLGIPQLTSDRRKELTKLVSKQAEEGKVAIRNIRRDALKAYEKLEKEKKLSEDNVKDLSSDLQKVTDDYVKKIESVQKQKEKELLTV